MKNAFGRECQSKVPFVIVPTLDPDGVTDSGNLARCHVATLIYYSPLVFSR